MGKNYLDYSFPAIPGSEGVGIVEKVGANVKSIKEKDMVMFVKPFQGMQYFFFFNYRNMDRKGCN